eukprot:scaffold91639_cov62-Phaeocystis_antarctica.AAC.4
MNQRFGGGGASKRLQGCTVGHRRPWPRCRAYGQTCRRVYGHAAVCIDRHAAVCIDMRPPCVWTCCRVYR